MRVGDRVKIQSQTSSTYKHNGRVGTVLDNSDLASDRTKSSYPFRIKLDEWDNSATRDGSTRFSSRVVRKVK